MGENMKRIKLVFIILLLCLIIITGNVSSFHNKKLDLSNRWYDNIQSKEGDSFDDFLFEPMDIQLKDDAYHGIRSFHSYEWWYFDANLDSGYCIQLSIRVLNVLNRGLYTIGANIYKDGELILNNQNIYFKNQIFASTTEPLIILDGKEIMRGYIDENNGDWVYLLNLEIDNIRINLTYVGDTKGWKGLTPGIGWWGVILPNAKVTGDLCINNIILDASGYGYHDHNWEVTVSAGVNFGWYWGKIHSSSHTITWADVKMTRFSENPFVIINKKNGDYINIPSEAVHLVPNDLIFINGKLIPDSFKLIIDYNDIYVDVDMEVFETHHFRRFGFINYWRYHMHCNGYIIDGENLEIFDEDSIAEFLRFR